MPRHRISRETAVFMVITAATFDLMQLFAAAIALLPFLGILLGIAFSMCIMIAAGMTFFLWFKMLGVTFADRASKSLTWLFTFVIEFFPVVNIIPSWTWNTLWMIYVVRKEDAEYNKRMARRANTSS